MPHGQLPRPVDGTIPLHAVVHPHSLAFYADDQANRQRILNICNIFEKPIYYKVLNSAPERYEVLGQSGVLKPNCRVEILVSHKAPNPDNYGIHDRLRIQLSDNGSGTPHSMGKMMVPISLYASNPDKDDGTDNKYNLEQQTPAVTTHVPASSSGPSHRQQQQDVVNMRSASASSVVILTGVVCIIALLFPTMGDEDCILPPYLHLSVPLKLAFAFTLGLVTMAILRP